MAKTYFKADFFADSYEEGKYPQPASVAPEVRESPKFFLDWCHFVYSCYSYGTTLNVNGGVTRTGRSIEELRAYARGKQGTAKYRAWCDVLVKAVNDSRGGGLGTADRRSIMNISWDNVQVLSPMRDIMLSKLAAPRFEPVVKAVDTMSEKARREKYYRDKMSVDPRMKALFAQAGMQPDGITEGYAAMEPGDIDVLRQLGEYNLPQEVLMQDVVEASLDKTGWEEIAQMLNEDVADSNMMFCLAQALPKEGRIGIKYVDPAGIVSPVSKYKDGRDVPYRGFIEHINISQLRAESNLSEKELYLIAKNYSGYHLNTALRNQFPNFGNRGFREEFMQENNRQVYDNFGVCVMTLYFIANDAENYIVGTRRDGNAVFDRVGTAAKLNTGGSNDGKRMETVPIQYVYKCRWVVGTEYVFDYGKDDTIVRVGQNGSKQAVIPIIGWVGDGASIVERCISIVDDIQLATLKQRALLANLPPGPRLSIDTSLMEESVKFGGVEFNLMEVLKLYSGRGVFFYRSKPEFSNPDANGSNRPPIGDIGSGIQEDFNLFAVFIQQKMNELRQATGINEFVDGSANPQDVLIGVVQGLEAASNNSLKPYLFAGYSLYKSVVNVMARKYQMLALNGSISMRHWPVGGNTIKTLELTPDIALYDIEVSARILPSEQEMQLMMSGVLQKQQEGKLTDADVFIIMEMLYDKDLKKAKVYMARAVARNEERMAARQQELVAQQTKGNIETAKASEQARRDSILTEGEVEGRIEELKHQNRLVEMREQSRLKQQEMLQAAQQDIIVNGATQKVGV